MERMQGDAFVVVDRTEDVHADAEDILVFELGFPKQQYDPVRQYPERRPAHQGAGSIAKCSSASGSPIRLVMAMVLPV